MLPSSRLEQLPAELIDKILEYVLVPRSLRAGTSILRTTKHLNKAARNYLHNQIPWISLRLNLNPEELRNDPRLHCRCLSHGEDQDNPEGCMTACIWFPSPSLASDVNRQLGVPLISETLHTILILAEDLDVVISALRAYDLALCTRLLPHDVTPKQSLDRDRPCGLSIHIDTRPKPDSPTFSDHLSKHWLNAFCKLSGPSHRTTFSGQACSEGFKHLRAAMEVRRDDGPRLREILDHKEQTRYEALEEIMRLKHQGDELLLGAEAQYHEAYLHYRHAILLSSLWSANDVQPAGSDFWSRGNAVHDYHVLACYCNMAIAYLTGDLGRPATHGDGEGTMSAAIPYPLRLSTDFCNEVIESWFYDEDHYRYTELYYVVLLVQIVYHDGLLRLHDTHAAQELQTYLDAMEMWWKFHSRQCGHEVDSTIAGHLHSHSAFLLRGSAFTNSEMDNAASTSTGERDETSKVHETVNKMRDLVRGIRIAPVQWYLHPQDVPEKFREHLEAIAPAQHANLRNLGCRTCMTNVGNDNLSLEEVVMFPNTVWLTDQERQAGETTPRHKI